MTKRLVSLLGLSIGLYASASALPVDALAQTGGAGPRPAATDAAAGKAPKAGGAAAAGASGPDMRLWSFGDCDRNFPYVETPEHKECVRVVGSEEAKDARAAYFCDVSHAKDPAEAKRCKEAYLANKKAAEQEGFRAEPSASPPVAVPAAAVPKPDQAAAIASLTRALKAVEPDQPVPAAAAAPSVPEPAPAPPPADSGSSASNIILVLAVIMLLAGLWMRHRGRANPAFGPANATTRRSGGPRTVAGPKTVSGPRTVNGPRTVSGPRTTGGPPKQY